MPDNIETLKELVQNLDEFIKANFQTITDEDIYKSAKFRRHLAQTGESLLTLAKMLDPVREPELILDPSDPKVIGKIIANTLLEQPRHPLKTVGRFYGSGVYAIYYKGDFEAYRLISKTDHPLYVGKADPADLDAVSVQEQGEKLAGRLKDHLRSIKYAGNLNADDFDCRFLVVKSAWQKTAEDYLIGRFQPVWNNEMNVCFGFGKHGDSSSTRRNTRSPWDTVHMGRPWAKSENNVANPKSAVKIIAEIKVHLEKTFIQQPKKRFK